VRHNMKLLPESFEEIVSGAKNSITNGVRFSNWTFETKKL